MAKGKIGLVCRYHPELREVKNPNGEVCNIDIPPTSGYLLKVKRTKNGPNGKLLFISFSKDNVSYSYSV